MSTNTDLNPAAVAPHPYRSALIHLLLRPSRKVALRQAEAMLAAIAPMLRKRAKAAREAGQGGIILNIADVSGAEFGYEAEFKRALSKLVEQYPKSFKKIEVALHYTSDPSTADLLVVMDSMMIANSQDEDEAMVRLISSFASMKDGAVMAYVQPSLSSAAVEGANDVRLLALGKSDTGVTFSNLEAAVANNVLEEVEGDLSEFDFTGYKLDTQLEALRANILCRYSLTYGTGHVEVTNGKVKLMVDGAVKAKKIADFSFPLLNVSGDMIRHFVTLNFQDAEFDYRQMWFAEGGKFSGDSFAIVNEDLDLDEVTLEAPRLCHLFTRYVSDLQITIQDGALSDTIAFDAATGGEPAAPPADVWDAAEAEEDAQVPEAEEIVEDALPPSAGTAEDVAATEAEAAAASPAEDAK